MSTCSAGGTSTSVALQSYPGMDGTLPLAIASVTDVCATQTINLTLGGYSVSQVSYQWQEASSAIGPYANVPGQTNTIGQVSGITVNTWFEALVSCSANNSYSLVSLPVQLSPITSITYAPVPFLENFDNTWESRCDLRNVPKATCWTSVPTAGNNSWRRQDDGSSASWSSLSGTNTPLTGAGCADFNSSNTPNGNTGSMSLYLNMSAAAPNYSLSFYYKNNSGSDSLEIFISTNAGTTSTKIGGYHVNNLWTRKVIDLGPVNSSSCIITFSATSDFGADDIAIDSLEVKTCPNFTASSSSAAVICANLTQTLSASGEASSYYWNSSTISQSATVVTPSTNSVYSVVGSNGVCALTKTLAITVNSASAFTVSGATGLCVGQTASLSVTGITSYTWSDGTVSAPLIVAPITNTFYTVTSTGTNGCSSSTTHSVAVGLTLPVGISGPDAICSGQSLSLTASGGDAYSWSTGETTSTILPTPTITTTYSVVGASGTCTNSSVKAVSVSTKPTLTLSDNNYTICAGSLTTLTASGASGYIWSSGPTSSFAVVSALYGTTYSVTGLTFAGCTDSKTIVVSTLTVPVLTTAQSATAACALVPVTFTASGATTYSWTNGPVNTIYIVTPTSTQNYTVTGENPEGCKTAKSVSLLTYSLPIVTISLATPSLCLPGSITLTASGANGIAWSNGL